MQDDGVLAKILVPAHGGELACGQPIALLVEDQAAYAQFLSLDPSVYSGSAAAVSSPAAAPADSPAPVVAATPQRFSPAAKHRIASAGLSASAAVANLVGSAKHGIITKADIVNAQLTGALSLAPSRTAAVAAPSSSVPAAVVVPAPVLASVPASVPPPPPAAAAAGPVNDRYVDVPNSNMRKVIARRLTESKATVPHLYLSVECEIDALLELRKTLKKDLDVAVSVNDIVIKSAALALRDTPRANARWNKAASTVQDGEGKVDISVAVRAFQYWIEIKYY